MDPIRKTARILIAILVIEAVPLAMTIGQSRSGVLGRLYGFDPHLWPAWLLAAAITVGYILYAVHRLPLIGARVVGAGRQGRVPFEDGRVAQRQRLVGPDLRPGLDLGHERQHLAHLGVGGGLGAHVLAEASAEQPDPVVVIAEGVERRLLVGLAVHGEVEVATGRRPLPAGQAGGR